MLYCFKRVWENSIRKLRMCDWTFISSFVFLKGSQRATPMLLHTLWRSRASKALCRQILIVLKQNLYAELLCAKHRSEYFEGLPFLYFSLVALVIQNLRCFFFHFKSPPFWLQLPIEWQKWLAYLIEFREQFVQQGETRYPVPADCLFVFY